jgi:hypothetical protein
VVQLTLIGIGVSAGVEALLFKVHPRWGRERHIGVHRAGAIAGIGVASRYIGILLGFGVYGYGYSGGLRTPSHLSALITPLASWPEIGIMLLFYAWRRQVKSRPWILVYVVSTVMLTFIAGLLSSSFADVYVLFLVTGVAALLVGAVRLRLIIGLLAVLILAWPSVYALRNQGRIAAGATFYAYATSSDAQARISFDRLMSNAKVANESGVTVSGLPSYMLILRSGLIPRAVDSHRPLIQTGTLISEATGGTGRSSETFTTFGELWFLHGYGGFVLADALIALFGTVLFRQRGPYAFVLFGGVVANLLQAEAAFPDAIAGFLQFAVSAAVALMILRPVRASRGLRRPESRLSS